MLKFLILFYNVSIQHKTNFWIIKWFVGNFTNILWTAVFYYFNPTDCKCRKTAHNTFVTKKTSSEILKNVTNCRSSLIVKAPRGQEWAARCNGQTSANPLPFMIRGRKVEKRWFQIIDRFRYFPFHKRLLLENWRVWS